MHLVDQIKEKARKNPQTVVLPESYDERMLFAAIAMVCSPDEQKRFTETPAVDFGMPASSAA